MLSDFIKSNNNDNTHPGIPRGSGGGGWVGGGRLGEFSTLF